MSDHIQAKSITLVDDEGAPRIHMDASGPEGYATFGMYSRTGRKIEISAQPSGEVVISVTGTPGHGSLTIGDRGIVLRADDGRLGITIGKFGTEEPAGPQVVVYRDGQPSWRSPA